jgi:hypothetical protein
MMNSSALELSRKHLEIGLQEILGDHSENNFVYGIELAIEVTDSQHQAESVIAKNILLTYMAKMLEATLTHIDNSKQLSGDFLSCIMRTFRLLSEMKLPFELDFMEIYGEMFLISINSDFHMHNISNGLELEY